ncbi:MAG: hypothetical protein AB1735_01885 [Pseudomonadota bacterium]
MPKHWQLLHVEPQAPAKPALGQPCNGCGLCCLTEPCPLGIVLSLRVRGACRSLRWDASQARYRCGALLRLPAAAQSGHQTMGLRLPLGAWLRALWNRLALRWIAAGSGCDCAWEAETCNPAQTPSKRNH